VSKIPPELAENLSFIINQTATDQWVWFDGEMKALRLDRARWRVLGYVNFFNNINQSELARLLGVGKAPLGESIRKLEREGMIIREPSLADRRSYNLRVADSYTQLASLIRRLMELESERLLTGLSEKERTQLRKTLRRIRNNICRTSESGEVSALKREIVAEMDKLKKRKTSPRKQID